uniref:Uncharacterized protein n=1 Tax=Strigamia maritima TaxID=126957 RepID=T1JLT4_STRMM
MTNEHDDSVLTTQELSGLEEIDSRLFGFLKLSVAENAPKKVLVQKAIKHFEKLLIQVQQEREKQKNIQSKQNDDQRDGEKNCFESSLPQFNPKVFKQLGHFHLLLEDYTRALSAYQKFYQLKKDNWKDAPFLYGLGIVYFHFTAFKW